MRYLLFCVCLLFSLQGRAQTAPNAKAIEALKDKAWNSFRIAEYQEALDLYKELYRLTKNPRVLPNIGNCYQKLKRYEDALSSYKGFLLEAPKDDVAPLVEVYVKEVEAFLRQGSIEVSTNQDPADVYLDGKYQGATPLVVKEVLPGDHQLSLEKPGVRRYQKNVTLGAQQKLQLLLTLQPLPGSIEISSEQDPAEVYVDGIPLGASPKMLAELPPGKHRVALDKKGFARYEIEIDVSPAQNVILRPVLKVATSRLELVTNLKNADVRLNSQRMGKTDASGLLVLDVPVGQYELGISSPWFTPHTQKLLLLEEEPQKVEATLKAESRSLGLYAAPPLLLITGALLGRRAQSILAEVQEAQDALDIINPAASAELAKDWSRGVSLVVIADLSTALALVSGSVAVWRSLQRHNSRAYSVFSAMEAR